LEPRAGRQAPTCTTRSGSTGSRSIRGGSSSTRNSSSIKGSRPVLGFLLLFVLAGWPAAFASSVRVTGIRTGITEGRVRVVLDLTGPVRHQVWTPTDPERIAIDIHDAAFDDAIDRIQLDDPTVRQIRVNRLPGPKAQLVLDLTARARYEVFSLPPGGGYGHRLVCDVYPAVPSPRVGAEPASWTVVIDPGHGGKDPGATSRAGDREADICLDVGKRLEKLLAGAEGITPHLTRSKNLSLGLRERILAAEARDADAFISIHINAARSSKVKGAEVFFLSLKGATDEASREVARLENLGGDFDSFPLDEELKDLPFGIDLRQSATLERSSLLAESVLGSFEKEGLAASRGVKQARFIVLKSIRIPSVLVELGFISNQQELKRLRDPSYRQKLAEVLEDGILEYIRRYAPQRNP